MSNKIKLPMGWWMEIEPRGEGEADQGFVFSPDGRESASLACALGTGMTSGNDEREIPAKVLEALQQYEEKYA